MPKTAFKVCPKCGSDSLKFDDLKKFYCSVCNWTFFHNVATAVAGILKYNNEVILTVRAHDPDVGKLDLPGGFVDPGETAEEALIREVKEELDVDIEDLKYLFSFSNEYRYKGINYNTCDLFFEAELKSINFSIEQSEISDIIWVNKSTVIYEKIAFRSLQNGLQLYFELDKDSSIKR